MTTFDRYLLRSFFYVFFVTFVTTFGLRVVIDLLENIDEFLLNSRDKGTAFLLWKIAEYYGYHALFFIDLAGPILTVVVVMVVLILYQRSGELYPLLAAGVPTYQAMRGLVFAAVAMSTLFVVNQEMVIPRIASIAYEKRGAEAAATERIEPTYDHSTRIAIDGRALVISEHRILDPQFDLPAPEIVSEQTVIKGKQATFHPAKGKRPAGWLIQEVTTSLDKIELTSFGASVVAIKPDKGQVFIATPVNCDQLYKRTSSYTMLATRDLLDRLKSPAFNSVSLQRIEQHVHGRLTQPILNLFSVLMVIPLMIRRESTGLVADTGLCGLMLAAVFGLTQASLSLGKTGVMPADLAAWVPVIVSGTAAAWLTGVVKT